MKLLRRDYEDIGIEWTENTFGYLSMPAILIGILLFSFPDMVYKIYLEIQYRGMKPNREFEGNRPKKDIPMSVERILKSIGLIAILIGFIWFWFSREIFELIF